MDLKSVFKASSMDEALKLLNEYSDKAKVIAGGTDIVIELKERKLKAEVMIDIADIAELRFIKDAGDYVEIGAATTFTDMWTNELLDSEFKGLAEAARSVGSPQIRNRGTVGGNIANGSPAADTVPPLMALDATCVIKSLNGEREVALKNLHTGKGSVDIKGDELLYSIKVNKLGSKGALGFSKLGLRNALAISRLSVAVSVKVDESGICTESMIGSGSLSRCPERESKIEELLVGKKLDEATLEEVACAFEDHIKERLAGRSTMEFKSEAVKGAFKDALTKAVAAIN
ncbi:MAG: FAD binding domain-containing protein [Clostridium sp.]|uniref:FAD binding domain-containing protein n=1 Tax=Clostridium sp. TaxID=1506 RepID=UPI002FCB3AA9